MPTPTETFRQKAPEIMAQLMKDFDLTAVQAAAILGNLGHESNGFTQQQEVGPRAGRGGLGWGQWTGPRRVAFEQYCARHNLDPKSDKANYAWLYLELRTTEKKAITALKKATTLSAAVRAFELAYERAGVKAYASREKWAQRALDAGVLHGDAEVRRIQQRLTDLHLGKIVGPIDGIVGPDTKEAIRAFQACRGGLAIDGMPGPETKAALLGE